MRKITKKAVDAFYNFEKFRLSNTDVDIIRRPHGTVAEMYLHNNLIARLDGNTLSIDNCGWQTLTTKERLNGILFPLGMEIKQIKFEWYLFTGLDKIPFEKIHYIDVEERRVVLV